MPTSYSLNEDNNLLKSVPAGNGSRNSLNFSRNNHRNSISFNELTVSSITSILPPLYQSNYILLHTPNQHTQNSSSMHPLCKQPYLEPIHDQVGDLGSKLGLGNVWSINLVFIRVAGSLGLVWMSVSKRLSFPFPFV